MKILVLIILMFSFEALGGAWINTVDFDNAKVGLSGATIHSLKTECSGECWNLKACSDLNGGALDVRRCKKTPKYVKKGPLSCVDSPSCSTAEATLDCSIYASGSFSVIVADFSETYCAEPNGFDVDAGLIADSQGITDADQGIADAATEVSNRATKKGTRFTALKACGVNYDSLTMAQLRMCVRRLVREALGPRLPLSEL